MVNFLWNLRHQKIFYRRKYRESGPIAIVRRPSRLASLVCAATKRKITATSDRHFRQEIVAAGVHRFEELIAGRAYLIEVSAVAKDRWRAHIVRVPGVPTALMPFYGTTPDEAARQLSEWLTRAHARAAAVST
jgi:hypothetical protein